MTLKLHFETHDKVYFILAFYNVIYENLYIWYFIIKGRYSK